MVEDALIECAERERERELDLTFLRISEDPFLTARLLVTLRQMARGT